MSLPIDILYLNKNLYRTIPNIEKYNTLKSFVNEYSSTKMKVQSTGLNPNIPTFIKEKYNNKLIISKHGDKSLNMKMRDILSKISESNLNNMIIEFNKFDLSYNVYDFIDTLYDFSIDLIYLANNYIQLIKSIKNKYLDSYNQFIDKVIYICYNPLKFEDEKKTIRWTANNAIFIAKLFNENLIGEDIIDNIITFFMKNNNNIDYLLELFKEINTTKLLNADKYSNYLLDIYSNEEFPLRVKTIIDIILDEKF